MDASDEQIADSNSMETSEVQHTAGNNVATKEDELVSITSETNGPMDENSQDSIGPELNISEKDSGAQTKEEVQLTDNASSSDLANIESDSESCLTEPTKETQEDEDKHDVFYFESDHAALKCNEDYQALLKTVTILEAQRVKAVQDIDKLVRLQGEALADPIAFARKLQNNVDLGKI